MIRIVTTNKYMKINLYFENHCGLVKVFAGIFFRATPFSLFINLSIFVFKQSLFTLHLSLTAARINYPPFYLSI